MSEFRAISSTQIESPAEPQAMPIKGRSELLDAARGWAILGVVICHSGQAISNLPQWADLFVKSGQYGVQLFFVISAITIFSTLQRAVRKGGSAWDRAGSFWIRRYFRIAPIYYLGLAFYWLFWGMGAVFFKLDFIQYYTPLNILSNLLFVHSFVPTGANNIVVPGGWSIGVEMMFYLIAPAVATYITSATGALKTATAALVIGSSATALICYWTKGTFFVANNSFLYFWFFSQFYIFFLGYALYLKFSGILFGDTRLNPAMGYLALATAVVLYFAAVTVGWALNISHVLAVLLISIAACLFLLSMATYELKILTSKPLLKLGQVSYSVYISHFAMQMPILFLSRRSHAIHALLQGRPVVALILVTAAILCSSYIIALQLRRWVEIPFIDFGHRLATRAFQDRRREESPA